MSKEQNELIAEFMGLSLEITEHEEGTDYEWLPRILEDHHWPFESPPPFDTNWNWLIAVVEKIKSLDHIRVRIIMSQDDEAYGCYQCWIEGYGHTHYSIPQIMSNNATLLPAVYNAISTFVEWYNKNVKP